MDNGQGDGVPTLEARAIAAQSGDDKEKWKIIYEHYPMMRTEIRKIVRSKEEAEDCAQDAIMKAWEKFYQCDPKTVSGWLKTIAHTGALDRKRTLSKREINFGNADNLSAGTSEDSCDDNIIDEEAESEQEQRKKANREWNEDLECRRIPKVDLDEGIAHLPDRQQQVMAMHDDGMSRREIAIRLDITENAVKTALHKARKNLEKQGGTSNRLNLWKG